MDNPYDVPPKPPDEYIVIKNSLLNFANKSDQLKSTHLIATINDACCRSNLIVTYTYQFLRLFCLHGQHIDGEFIPITKDIIHMAMKIFIQDTHQGRIVLNTNKPILDFFNKFYEHEFFHLFNGQKISGKNLSGILDYAKIEMLTSIENNIRVHFVDYLNRYVNCSFKKEHKKLLENLKDKERETLKTKLNHELWCVKQDLIYLTSTRDPKYDYWIYSKRHKILPHLDEKYKDHLVYLKTHPQEYLQSMKRMSSEIINLEFNSFQFFPLRTNIIPKNITIDTKILIELLVTEGLPKNTYFSNIDKYKKELWSSLFNMNNKMFKQKNRTFDYRILTDGFSVSIQFIHNNFIEKKQIKKLNMKNGRSKANDLYKNLDRSQIEKIKENRKSKIINLKVKDLEKAKQMKEDFKNKSKKEKEKIKDKMKKKVHIEFPYLEELNEEQIKELKEKKELEKIVYVDPGKRNLLFMMGENGEYFRYSNKERIYESKKIIYQKKLQKEKNISDTTLIESKLSKYNSKACKIEEIKEYIKKKNELNEILTEEYMKPIYRKYKWYAHINRKRSEDNLLNKIEKVYGKDLVMIYGDWSVGKSMRNYISTPNMGLKKKLATKFKIYSIDEYKTSKINYKSLEEVKNLYLPDRKGVQRKKHSILTYETESKIIGCINRNKSAVNGMKLIGDYFMENKSRHPIYQRKAIDRKSTQKEKTLKDKVKRVVVKRIDESSKEQLQKSSEIRNSLGQSK
jgi:hypothetical protein